MAKVTAVPQEPPKPRILLDLSYEEAKTLQKIFGSIGGLASETRRKHTDDIYHQLEKLIPFEVSSRIPISGYIKFKNEEGI